MNDTILCCWLSGAEAEFIETIGDEEIIAKTTDILRSLLADPYVPRPIRVVRSAWKSDIFSRGSFTSLSSESSQQDIENLAKPIFTKTLQSRVSTIYFRAASFSLGTFSNRCSTRSHISQASFSKFQPKLLFAGEATHSSFYSTAHGAFISGRRCADMLTADDLEGCDLPAGWLNSSSRRPSVNDLESWLKGIDIRREIR